MMSLRELVIALPPGLEQPYLVGNCGYWVNPFNKLLRGGAIIWASERPRSLRRPRDTQAGPRDDGSRPQGPHVAHALRTAAIATVLSLAPLLLTVCLPVTACGQAGAESTKDAESAGQPQPPLVRNDAVVAGMLFGILGLVFWSAHSGIALFRRFYQVVPMLLMCYFLPSVLTACHIVDPKASQLGAVASNYLLPTCLVLLTLSVDLREILKLGKKALVMFLTGTLGVMLGGPLAILIVGSVNPSVVGGADQEAVWRGMSTIAGSWIGGAANQAAMKEIFRPSDQLFSVMVAIDVLVAQLWMMFVLLGVSRAKQIDRLLRADSSSIYALQAKMESMSAKTARIPSTHDLMVIAAVGFGATGLSHWGADLIAPWFHDHYPALKKLGFEEPFFWLIVLATTIGLLLSFTPARRLEGAGASKVGTIFIFLLVTTIGLKMHIEALFEQRALFLVGLVWMAIHVGVLVVVGWLIRAPYFFLAVGSKANIGGAASAPIVAAAFHPCLAPVGVLLAVMGYVLGTYGAWLSALMMQAVAPSP